MSRAPFRSGLVVTVLALAASTAAAAVPAPTHPGEDGAPFPRAVSRSALGTAILNVDTAETFATIQDAITDVDTLPGHTLQVQTPSHFEGLVLVNKSLTLEGQTGTETVFMTVDTGNTGDARAWFLVDPGIDLTVRDLTFDGDGHLVYQAFRHKGTGSFDNCTFRDLRYNESGPDYAGLGVVAFGSNVDVRNSVFENIGRVGVLAFGPGLTGAVIEGNTYTGKGTGNWLDYGFEVGGGATATVRGNVATGNLGVASDGSTSGAVMATTLFGPGTTATFESNDLFGNTTGVIVGFDDADTATVDAFLNRIFGNTEGMASAAGAVTSTAENNWWGCNAGPGVAGCDVAVGPVDADPWLLLAAAADPTAVLGGGASTVTADLLFNSDGVDTSVLGFVPDGIAATFSATLGSVSPAATTTSSGLAVTTFVAGLVSGTAIVSTTIDNQTVDVAIAVLGNVLAIPTLCSLGLVVLLLLMVVLAWRRLGA